MKALLAIVLGSIIFLDFPGSTGGGYTANTAVFDGTNDYMMMTSSGPTGLAASGTQFTFSAWVKFTGGTGSTDDTVFSFGNSAPSVRIAIYRSIANKIALFARNAAGTTILDLVGSTVIGDAGGWLHIYACIDLTSTSLRKIYINGVAETLVVTTYNTAGIIAFTSASARYAIGSNINTTPIEKITASVAELWWNDSYLDDPTKFATGGIPISLGSDGSTPTGAAPVFYLMGSGNGFNINSGTGGNYTVTGSLGTDTPP